MIKTATDHSIAQHFAAARERCATLLEQAAGYMRAGDTAAGFRAITQAERELRLRTVSSLATHPGTDVRKIPQASDNTPTSTPGDVNQGTE